MSIDASNAPRFLCWLQHLSARRHLRINLRVIRQMSSIEVIRDLLDSSFVDTASWIRSASAVGDTVAEDCMSFLDSYPLG